MEKRSRPGFGRKFKFIHLIIVALVVMVVTAAATYLITTGGFGAQKYYNDAKAYVEIEKIIEENYIGDANSDTLYNAAASAMVRSIDDKWSYYMSPEEYAAYKLSSANEYAGIGVSVKLNDKGKFEIFAVEEHEMHSEFCIVPKETADIINETKKNGGRVIAVGTTSCRTLESFAKADGTMEASSGWTNIFIYPGYTFKCIDALITNFHLPESTLIMLVSALAGRENVLHAYSVAVEEEYRFFSFGDAMIVE